jgi:hypothetical protein
MLLPRLLLLLPLLPLLPLLLQQQQRQTEEPVFSTPSTRSNPLDHSASKVITRPFSLCTF